MSVEKDTNGGKCAGDVLPKPKSIFPIVGIGASAGGLEAFVELLKNLDVKTGMAFVLVQHLDPTHESLLTSILARSTVMKLCEVTDGTQVLPDHVFVMPPNAQMSIVGDVLKLVPREDVAGEPHRPIDHFLQSLGAERKENAIGMILSGTGSDGAKGVAAIGAEGGVTFAQDPRSAKFDGMPNAAIISGVEFVMTPTAMARELGILGHATQAKADGSQSVAAAAEPHELEDILLLLKNVKGMDFSAYKSPTVQRRIHRRMALCRLTTPERYLAHLEANPAELENLYEDILVKVTSFFRGPESFVALKTTVFAALLGQTPRPATLRVWVPGCATGEEAYSIAICLLEAIEGTGSPMKVEIFATDVSDVALTKARIGVYPEGIAAQVSGQRLARFFVKEGDSYRVGPRVRECCVFAKQNVGRDPPFSRLDLISCRNLLIYLTPPLQKRILATFHFALNRLGFLALGNAETIGTATELFGVADGPSKIFSKKAGVRSGLVADYGKDGLNRVNETVVPFSRHQSEAAKKLDLKSNADRAILSKFAPPGVVINDRMEVLEVRGDTTPFLLLAAGEITSDLAKLCRPGLLVELRQAVHEATAAGAPVTREGWIKVAGKPSVPLVIDVVPFKTATAADQYFAVHFREQAAPAGERLSEPTADEASEIGRVERELIETKNYLNAIIEKEQATNEELKSASEEILSANEELQSTNEEMATAKEETQATNEELTTVNDELQDRNHELARVNSDMANLFGSVQIPIVMLSDKLVVRRFTRSAEKLFGLIASDVGRPLEEINSKFQINGLSELVSEVIESLNTKDQDIQNRDGKWYSLRIRPYRTIDNKIEGAVLALVDVDSFKRSFDRLKEAHDFADAIVQTAPVPLLVLDDRLMILTVNESFCQHFCIKEADAKNVRIYDLSGGQWNSAKLRELLEEILPKNEIMENFTIDHEFEGLGRRILRLSARRLVQHDDKAAKILLAIQDLTEEKRVEEGVTAAKDAAESANQAKTDFLANMSHEIRTPLGVILGYSEILADPGQSPKSILNSATRIRKNVEHLTELINEILDIAKIEAGKLDLSLVRFALLPELSEVFTLLQSRAEGKGIGLKVTFHGDIPEYIKACPKSLRQILFNIVGNAIKFTDQGGVDVGIEVRCNAPDADGKTASLSFVIKDTGCGLSKDQQGRLFQSFSQADNSVTRKFGGTGLGLMLARRLAEALGGTVVLTKSEVGKGSVFTVTIDPGAMGDVVMLKNVTQDSLERAKVELNDWFGANRRLAGTRILVVEDGPDNQALIAHFLVSSGAHVNLAKNGQEGVQMAQAEAHDLVLMDIQMPILSGYDATSKLRAEGYKGPIVALTAHAMQGEREKCLKSGFDDYLSKPIKPNLLIDLVTAFVKKKVLTDPSFEPCRSPLADDPAMAPLVERFLLNLPERLASLHGAQSRSDWDEIVRQAHQMSGAAGGYGFPEMSQIAARLEAQANDDPNPSSVARAITDFSAMCDRILTRY